MDSFNIGNFKIEVVGEKGLSIDSVTLDKTKFHSRLDLEKMAYNLLDKEEYKNFIIHHDGCFTYKTNSARENKKQK